MARPKRSTDVGQTKVPLTDVKGDEDSQQRMEFPEIGFFVSGFVPKHALM
jgi:hypothetical protein